MQIDHWSTRWLSVVFNSHYSQIKHYKALTGIMKIVVRDQLNKCCGGEKNVQAKLELLYGNRMTSEVWLDYLEMSIPCQHPRTYGGQLIEIDVLIRCTCAWFQRRSKDVWITWIVSPTQHRHSRWQHSGKTLDSDPFHWQTDIMDIRLCSFARKYVLWALTLITRTSISRQFRNGQRQRARHGRAGVGRLWHWDDIVHCNSWVQARSAPCFIIAHRFWLERQSWDVAENFSICTDQTIL